MVTYLNLLFLRSILLSSRWTSIIVLSLAFKPAYIIRNRLELEAWFGSCRSIIYRGGILIKQRCLLAYHVVDVEMIIIISPLVYLSISKLAQLVYQGVQQNMSTNNHLSFLLIKKETPATFLRLKNL